MSDGPRPTGKPHESLNITGMLFPWNGLEPVLLMMPGSELLYLPLFSTPEQLNELMMQAKTPFVSIKKIDDGAEFLSGIYDESPGARENVRVILNPYFLPNGRVRFTQIQLPGTDPV